MQNHQKNKQSKMHYFKRIHQHQSVTKFIQANHHTNLMKKYCYFYIYASTCYYIFVQYHIMSLDNQRLWKQIGNQTHKRQQNGHSTQQNSYFAQKKQKINNQQILQEIESFIPIVELSSIQHSHITYNADTKRSSVPHTELKQQGECLEEMLKQLQLNNQSFNVKRISTKQSFHNEIRKQQKLKRSWDQVESIISSTKIQIQSIKESIQEQLKLSQQLLKNFTKQFKTVQQILEYKLFRLQKQNADKDLQFQNIKQLYDKNQKRIKILQRQNQQLKQCLECQKQINQNLLKQNQSLKLQNSQTTKQNVQVLEKLFDLQQKIQSFDLCVEKKVSQILEQKIIGKNTNTYSENRKNQLKSSSEEQGNIKQKYNFLQQSSIEKQRKLSQNYKMRQIFQPNLCSTNSSQNKRGFYLNNKSEGQKLFSYPHQTPVLNSRYSTPTTSMRASFNNFFTKIHNQSQNINSRSNLTERGNDSFSPSKGSLFRKQRKQWQNKPQQIQQLSQKLNIIRTKIQNQINNILHY